MTTPRAFSRRVEVVSWAVIGMLEAFAHMPGNGGKR